MLKVVMSVKLVQAESSNIVYSMCVPNGEKSKYITFAFTCNGTFYITFAFTCNDTFYITFAFTVMVLGGRVVKQW